MVLDLNPRITVYWRSNLNFCTFIWTTRPQRYNAHSVTTFRKIVSTMIILSQKKLMMLPQYKDSIYHPLKASYWLIPQRRMRIMQQFAEMRTGPWNILSQMANWPNVLILLYNSNLDQKKTSNMMTKKKMNLMKRIFNIHRWSLLTKTKWWKGTRK